MSFGPPPTTAPAELDLRVSPAHLTAGPRQPPPTIPGVAPPAAAHAPSVDVAALTEAVQRGLFRSLARERERRGGRA
jgi:hypothetical protein